MFRYSSKLLERPLIWSSSAPSAFKETADNDKELGETRLWPHHQMKDQFAVTYTDVELLGAEYKR